MYTSTYVTKGITDDSSDIRAVQLSSHHARTHVLARKRTNLTEPRSESVYGTKSYRDALQRSFNRAKLQVFFNPDMQYFVTLTYRGDTHTIDDVMYDMKIWLKHERRLNKNIKYIWVAEYQKRGSIHVHMITNAKFTMRKNKNGYDEINYWADKIGFTSVLHISDFDRNFKPYLYLFKYMRKAQRIGKSFLHTSRNINNFEKHDNLSLKLENYSVVNQEMTKHTYPNNPDKTITFLRYYMIHDNIDLRTKYISNLRKAQQWQNILLHSTKARERKVENHTLH